jgi:CRISPR-associated protein Cas2
MKKQNFNDIPSLPQKIKIILKIIKDKPKKPGDMIYIIMYDIESNKVRSEIAKFLIKKGCIRIQKSVYLIRNKPEHIMKIYRSLVEVQQTYDNQDSIILVPVDISSLKSMKLIGKEVNIERIIEKPNTLFI